MICKRCNIDKDISEYYRNNHICNACKAAHNRILHIKRKLTNNNKQCDANIFEYLKKWREENPEKAKISRAKRNRKNVDLLSDAYIRQQLRQKFPAVEITTEMIQIHREQMLRRRIMREIKNGID